MTSILTKHKVAAVLLSYSDYESLELSLAVHGRLIEENESLKDLKLFILQNGRGTYDCERTYQVALRYQNLYPNQIKVIDYIKPNRPYFSIKELLHSQELSEYEYIIKLDDDVFPLTGDWAEKLVNTYFSQKEKLGDKLVYSTGLVNNNPYGFKKVLEIFGTLEEFRKQYARDHMVGLSPEDSYSPFRILQKGEISTGGGGTIWRYPYLARWIHSITTLNPDAYIEKTKSLNVEELNTKERYSINCLFFKKSLWDDIDSGGSDDEFMLQKYCIHNNKTAVVDLSIPMCHLFFYTQRLENKDLLPIMRDVYERWLNLKYPITLFKNKEDALEDRLRFLEEKFSYRKTTRNKFKYLKAKFMQAISSGKKKEYFKNKAARYK